MFALEEDQNLVVSPHNHDNATNYYDSAHFQIPYHLLEEASATSIELNIGGILPYKEVQIGKADPGVEKDQLWQAFDLSELPELQIRYFSNANTNPLANEYLFNGNISPGLDSNVTTGSNQTSCSDFNNVFPHTADSSLSLEWPAWFHESRALVSGTTSPTTPSPDVDAATQVLFQGNLVHQGQVQQVCRRERRKSQNRASQRRYRAAKEAKLVEAQARINILEMQLNLQMEKNRTLKVELSKMRARHTEELDLRFKASERSP